MNIAIFASGGGSNAKCILQHFKNIRDIHVKLIVASKRTAGVLQHAADHGVSTHILDKKKYTDTEELTTLLEWYDIDVIVLAGFLWKIPPYLTTQFADKMLNIHPSLLPKYGGKGMYGMNVHRAVYASNDTTSGMTIHLVNEKYDDGKVLFQDSIDITHCQSPEEVGKAVLTLEHRHFATVIESYIRNSISNVI